MGNLIKDFWTYKYKEQSYFGIVEVIKGNSLSQKRNLIKYETHIEKALDYTMINDVTSHISIQTFCTWLKDRPNREDNEQRYYPFTLEFEPKDGNDSDALYEAAQYVEYIHSELGVNRDDILIMVNNNKSIYVQINPKAYGLKPDAKLNAIYSEMYKKIKRDLNLKNVDESIVNSSYKVMKAPNSFYKGGYFVRITAEELVKLMVGAVTRAQLTKSKRSLNINVPGEMSLKAVKLYRSAVKKIKYGKIDKCLEEKDNVCGGNCTQYFMTHMVEKGYRNYGLVSVAIYLKSLGYSKEETLKNLLDLAESWGHDETKGNIESKVNTVYRRNYRFSCSYAKTVFEDLGIEGMCSKCPFANKNKIKIGEDSFEIDPTLINRLWANKASTRHYLLYLKLAKEKLFNENINIKEFGINIRTVKEFCKKTGLDITKVEGVEDVINIKDIPSAKVYRLPGEFISNTAIELGDALKQYLRLFIKGYKAVERYILVRASKDNLMNELGYTDVSSLYKLLNKLKGIGLIKVHSKNNYTLYYKSYKVIELHPEEDINSGIEVNIIGQAVGQNIIENNSSTSYVKNYYGEQQKLNFDAYIHGTTAGDHQFGETIKYKGHSSNSSSFKYRPINLEAWIQECIDLNLTKEMVKYNSRKYGYIDNIEYILQQVFENKNTVFPFKLRR